jgi:hypothetical protein
MFTGQRHQAVRHLLPKMQKQLVMCVLMSTDAATALVDFIGKTHRWNATRTREREKVANVTNDSIRF